MSIPVVHTTRALEADGAGAVLVAWALGALAFTASLGWFFFGQLQVAEATGRARLEVLQTAHTVHAPVAGTILRTLQPQGSAVRRGDVLFELDTGSLALRMQEERARRQGLIAQAAALKDELVAARQHPQADGLRRQLAALEAEAASAVLALGRLALEIAHHQVRSPVDGQLGSTVPPRVGEHVSVGQALATVVPAGDFIAVAEFEPAAVLGRVRPGQSAHLRLDGFPWAQHGTVAATVSRVAGEIRDHRVRVEFTPDAAWPPGVQLQHGLSGTLEITLEAVSPAEMALRAAGLALGGGPRP
ncbi:MAG: HlyD family efflux transporter periplasmic adaptor subunit [Ideonella sp.]|nr:HlyD family efflux transporter periplasmic adaptor subunit [Ideonella sp.]